VKQDRSRGVKKKKDNPLLFTVTILLLAVIFVFARLAFDKYMESDKELEKILDRDQVAQQGKKSTGLPENVLQRAIAYRLTWKIKTDAAVQKLEYELDSVGIYYIVADLDKTKKRETVGFLKDLLEDTESQEVFRDYTLNRIMIILDHSYKLEGHHVHVDIRDGVKNVAKELRK
jgi:hypothetical protein